MSRRKEEPEMLAADAKQDQIIAALTEGARDDIEEWARFGRKINNAADTRDKCERVIWTREEMYRLVRLAHGAHGIITGRMLGRRI